MTPAEQDGGRAAEGRLPSFLRPLFWDCDPEGVDITKDAWLIMARTMERGTWEAMTWLRETYSREQLAAFLRARGSRVLPARDLSYWALICGIAEPEWRAWLAGRSQHHAVWWSRHAP